jgi:hypothetical protein
MHNSKTDLHFHGPFCHCVASCKLKEIAEPRVVIITGSGGWPAAEARISQELKPQR